MRSDLASFNIEIEFPERVNKLGTNPLEGSYLRHLSLYPQNFLPLAVILAPPWGDIAKKYVENHQFSHMGGDVFCYACRQGKKDHRP